MKSNQFWSQLISWAILIWYKDSAVQIWTASVFILVISILTKEFNVAMIRLKIEILNILENIVKSRFSWLRKKINDEKTLAGWQSDKEVKDGCDGIAQ